jgi:predicted DNA-binding ribbon-helix-helix protein
MTIDTYDKSYWHTRESRHLAGADGLDRVVTMERIYWGSFDFLTASTDLTAERLIDVAERTAAKHGMSFAAYFPECLAWFDHYYAEHPELLKGGTPARIVGGIGMVSRQQIEDLERMKTPPSDT